MQQVWWEQDAQEVEADVQQEFQQGAAAQAFLLAVLAVDAQAMHWKTRTIPSTAHALASSIRWPSLVGVWRRSCWNVTISG